MSASTAILQLHHREVFERTVTRGLLAGGAAGAAHFMATRAGNVLAPLLGMSAPQLFPASEATQFLPLTYATIVGVAVASARGDRLDRLLLIALGVVLPAIPWLLGLSAGWTVGLSAACAGALMVRSHLCGLGEEGQVGGGRPGLMNYALGALLTGGLAAAGTEVARAITFRLADFSTPPLLASLIAGVMLALFVGIGSVAGHLALKPDPVEARCEELIPQLLGEFKALANRALTLYQQCGKALAALPREPAREEMARTLAQTTREAVELAAQWSGLESQLQSGAVHDLSEQLAALTRDAQAARDPIARKQLEAAASSLREEMVRLEELSLQRERIVAKLKAQVALLERARVVLIGMQSGQMQLKAAELTALTRKLYSLSSLQSAEARLADAQAVSAELAQHEAHETIAAVTSPEAPAPVSAGPTKVPHSS